MGNFKIKMIQISKSVEIGKNKVLASFLARQTFDTQSEGIAAQILADINKKGDEAVLKYSAKYDAALPSWGSFRVGSRQFKLAKHMVSSEFKKAVHESYKRVIAFAHHSMRGDWVMPTAHGGYLGERFIPLDRIGVYVPGGAAPLASTVVMTVPLAKVAGVREIVACTPCKSDGNVDPHVLYALDFAGATEVYAVGGIQAIGMMAYGTETFRKVQKIVGPGGAYVTAAKRLVYGRVALDLVAGPSEIAVIADETAEPLHIACDLLSQAEHGTGREKVLLVTTSLKRAKDTIKEIMRLVPVLKNQNAIRKVIKNGMLFVIVKSLHDAVNIINSFAPEHLEIMVEKAKELIKRIKAAGAVFVGRWSPECVGDYVAGPSHVLPTGGTAAMFSGLTVEDFRRRSSIIAFNKNDLADVIPVIESFAKIEGLDAHFISAKARFIAR